MLVKPTRNTEKEYPCTNCGGPGNIVREGSDPRLKCMQCNFMYDASDSIAAQEAGIIPEGLPKLQDDKNYEHTRRNKSEPISSSQSKSSGNTKILSSMPAYAFIAEDGVTEFCGKRDFKKLVLRWEHSGLKYKVYELKRIKVAANIQVK